MVDSVQTEREYEQKKDKSFVFDIDNTIPKILPLTTFGEVQIKWNKEMLKPTNDTWFAEQLRKETKYTHVETQQEVIKPAFEVSILSSYVHESDIKFRYEYAGWIDENNMVLKLFFEQPDIVSMEIPADKVQV